MNRIRASLQEDAGRRRSSDGGFVGTLGGDPPAVRPGARGHVGRSGDRRRPADVRQAGRGHQPPPGQVEDRPAGQGVQLHVGDHQRLGAGGGVGGGQRRRNRRRRSPRPRPLTSIRPSGPDDRRGVLVDADAQLRRGSPATSASSRPNRFRWVKCWSTITLVEQPEPLRRPGRPGTSGSPRRCRTTPCARSRMLAPAEVPATSAPRRWAARIASPSGVPTTSVASLTWLPPVMNTAVQLSDRVHQVRRRRPAPGSRAGCRPRRRRRAR